MLELDAAIKSSFNGQTLLQSNISENYLASLRVISILKDRIFCLENKSSKTDTIIDLLSKQFTVSKHNISNGYDRSSCSANVKKSNTKDNCINDTVNETVNRNEKFMKKLAL